MTSDAKSKREKTDAPADPQVCSDPAKLNLLYNASIALASTTDLDHLLNIIGAEVQTVLGCDGVGVVLYDAERDDFYWRSVQDRDSLLSSAKEEIRIPKDQGVGGMVFRTGEPALIHDATTDERLYRQVETKSGFTTRSMICVPLETMEKRIGVLYALNKADGTFSEADVDILVALAGNVALALENASYYERLASSHNELTRLNHVKNKMLNHLSHELKTPLAIIEASLRIMERRLEAKGEDLSELPIRRITRNLERLKAIEKQVGHIVEEKDYGEERIISDFLDRLHDFIEVQAEEETALSQALALLKRKISEQFPSEKEGVERVSIQEAFRVTEFRVRQMIKERDLQIEFVAPDQAIVKVQPQILMSALGGLIRNAVENTPDKGKIVISGEKDSSGYKISVHDFGVGIPEKEQSNVFEGFYHLQETDLYSSGRRYAFNAGGTGTDLLKIKIFAERFGFNVRFSSRRCTCIPTAGDVCPGNIDECSCCEGVQDCYANGESEFVIEVPQDLVEEEAGREAVA
jgi:K+-sensing histidine kinase KdpD